MLNNFTYSKKYNTKHGTRYQCSAVGPCAAQVYLIGTEIITAEEMHSHPPKKYYTDNNGPYYVYIQRGKPVRRNFTVEHEPQILYKGVKENYVTAKRGRPPKKRRVAIDMIVPKILDVRSTDEHFLQESPLRINDIGSCVRPPKKLNKSTKCAMITESQNTTQVNSSKPMLQIYADNSKKVSKRNRPFRIQNGSSSLDSKKSEIRRIVKRFRQESGLKINNIKRGRPAKGAVTADAHIHKIYSTSGPFVKLTPLMARKRGRPPKKRNNVVKENKFQARDFTDVDTSVDMKEETNSEFLGFKGFPPIKDDCSRNVTSLDEHH
ncbi:uncharacterized protein LOC128672430 [Plodia interpunctella]|uniref:uncharacterized protein LOC128672430 n=1 Tax=Plodia interpunctella TaxID=58824 RepID=UPI002367B6A7|nr:uncharacterized protein LOC128672430 [Plodia interpunctella]